MLHRSKNIFHGEKCVVETAAFSVIFKNQTYFFSFKNLKKGGTKDMNKENYYADENWRKEGNSMEAFMTASCDLDDDTDYIQVNSADIVPLHITPFHNEKAVMVFELDALNVEDFNVNGQLEHIWLSKKLNVDSRKVAEEGEKVGLIVDIHRRLYYIDNGVVTELFKLAGIGGKGNVRRTLARLVDMAEGLIEAGRRTYPEPNCVITYRKVDDAKTAPNRRIIGLNSAGYVPRPQTIVPKTVEFYMRHSGRDVRLDWWYVTHHLTYARIVYPETAKVLDELFSPGFAFFGNAFRTSESGESSFTVSSVLKLNGVKLPVITKTEASRASMYVEEKRDGETVRRIDFDAIGKMVGSVNESPLVFAKEWATHKIKEMASVSGTKKKQMLKRLLSADKAVVEAINKKRAVEIEQTLLLKWKEFRTLFDLECEVMKQIAETEGLSDIEKDKASEAMGLLPSNALNAFKKYAAVSTGDKKSEGKEAI